MGEPRFGVRVWLAWLGMAVTVAFSLAAYAFTTFETKHDALERKRDMTQRLDRIEDLLTRLLRISEVDR